MKRACVIVLTIALSLTLCACKYSDYKKAVSAMKESDYATAYEAFSAIPDYRNSEELATECAYQMATDAFDAEDYEAAYSFFSGIPEYRDSLQKSNECSILLGYQAADMLKENLSKAVEERDEVQLCQLINKYLTMTHAHDEISTYMNGFVMETIRSQFESDNYDNYLFLDRLISLVENKEILRSNFGSLLSELNTTHSTQRVIAFLSGTWRRVDSSQSSGLRINVTSTENNTFAMILEDLSFESEINRRAKFHWDKGMVIWNNVQIADPQHITMDTMWLTSYYNLGVQANRYEDCIGYLDYNGMRIITQSTGEENIPWRDNFGSDIYVKESAIKKVPALSDSDFVLSFEKENPSFESCTANLNEWFSARNTLFCAYNDVNSLTTARGISVGSEWKNVVEQYGYGRGNLYVEGVDRIHARLKKANLKDEASGEFLCDILSGQADEYMEYTLDDSNQILRFYFDNGIVSWVCLYTV